MKRKLSVILLLTLILGTLVVTEFQRASANQIDIRSFLGLTNFSQGNSSQDNSNIEKVIPTATMAQEDIESIGNFDDLYIKVNRAQKTYWTQGWLHIKSQKKSYIPNDSVLPNGEKVPSETVSDEWFLLDSEGYVVQAVNISETGNEYTNQVAIYKNGVWTNLTLDFKTSAGKFKPELDWGFSKNALKHKNNLLMSSEKTTVDGQKFIIFSITEVFDNLSSFGKNKDGTDKLAYGFKQKIYYSPESDTPVISQTFHILPDGEEQLEYQVERTILEAVQDVPSNITQYIK